MFFLSLMPPVGICPKALIYHDLSSSLLKLQFWDCINYAAFSLVHRVSITTDQCPCQESTEQPAHSEVNHPRCALKPRRLPSFNSSGLGMAIQNLAQMRYPHKPQIEGTCVYHPVLLFGLYNYYGLPRCRCFDMVRSRHLHRPNGEVNPQPAIETPTMFSVLAAARWYTIFSDIAVSGINTLNKSPNIHKNHQTSIKIIKNP